MTVNKTATGIGIFVLLFSSVFFAVLYWRCNKQERPNIVFIVADDMGWNDVGFHGSNQIPTPNIDALAYNGVILNRHYTQQTCTPSRAALLTGNYPIRSGLQATVPIIAGEHRHLPLDMPTLPQQLKSLGYSTHLVGKWHVGASLDEVTPLGRGFDTHFGYWNGYIGYFDHSAVGLNDLKTNMTGWDMHDGNDPDWSTKGQYATDLFTNKSIDIINNSSNRENPFLLVLTHLAPHTGLFGEELETPDVDKAQKEYGYIEEPARRLYADIVNRLDSSIGRVMKALADKNILDNTIVVFVSDNGAQTQGLFKNYGSNWPLRGLKFTVFEGGVRTVAAIYSSKIKSRGVVSNQLFHISDWLPTLYTAAGGHAKDLGDIDGVNQWKTITDNEATQRNDVLLNIDEVLDITAIIGGPNGRYKFINGSFNKGEYDQHYGDSGRQQSNRNYTDKVMESDTNVAITQISGSTTLSKEDMYKIRYEAEIKDCPKSATTTFTTCDVDSCLFDLLDDPCETKNLIDVYPEVAEELKAIIREKHLPHLVPQQKVYVDPKADPKYCNGAWFTWMDPHVQCK